MDLLCPEHLDFDQGVPQIYDLDVLDSWIPEPFTDPMAVVDPFIVKCPVPKETDWETKKPAIEHFYLTENQTLNATIIFMREQHGFTATEKMYKRHFQLWGWHKYTKKGVRRKSLPRNLEAGAPLSPPEDSEPPKKKARVQGELGNSESTSSTLIPVDLKNFQQKATVFTAIKQLLDAHIRTTTASSRSCSSSKYQLIQGSSGPRLRHELYETLDTSDCERKLEWKVIERIFDQIEHHIKDDITSFVELCFLIPRALLFATESRVLQSYLSRLTQESQEKNIQGSFIEVGRLLQDIYEHQRESGLLDLLVFASSAFAAALVDKHGKKDRKSLLAIWDSLRVAAQLGPTVTTTWLGQWETLHMECMSQFGRHGSLTLSLEDDLSGLVQPSRLYAQASCPAEVEGLINGVRRKLFLIPSEGGRFEDDNHLSL